jgi:hypothetical protein
MAHPARFELTTSAFGGQRSIHLSYGCGRRGRFHITVAPRAGNGRGHDTGEVTTASGSAKMATMRIIRLCRTALVATVALFFTLVAFGNITAYGSNWLFVRHVMSMDTTFPESSLHWRAIASPFLQSLVVLNASSIWRAPSLEPRRRARPPRRRNGSDLIQKAKHSPDE